MTAPATPTPPADRWADLPATLREVSGRLGLAGGAWLVVQEAADTVESLTASVDAAREAAIEAMQARDAAVTRADALAAALAETVEALSRYHSMVATPECSSRDNGGCWQCETVELIGRVRAALAGEVDQ